MIGEFTASINQSQKDNNRGDSQYRPCSRTGAFLTSLIRARNPSHWLVRCLACCSSPSSSPIFLSAWRSPMSSYCEYCLPLIDFSLSFVIDPGWETDYSVNDSEIRVLVYERVPLLYQQTQSTPPTVYLNLCRKFNFRLISCMVMRLKNGKSAPARISFIAFTSL